uniref:Uncharacterized protein n=1 Tax=viral metagenome TaxID=1070528 RepID=A0A6M3LIB0_9ZZZZ
MSKSLTRWYEKQKWQRAKWVAGYEMEPSWIKKFKYIRRIVNPLFRDFGDFRRRLILFRNFI